MLRVTRGCVASLLRLYYSIELLYTADLTYAFVPVFATASAEFASIVLVACGPVMPRLYRYLREKYGRSKASLVFSRGPRTLQTFRPKRSPLDSREIETSASLSVPQIPSATLPRCWLSLSDPVEGEATHDFAKIDGLDWPLTKQGG